MRKITIIFVIALLIASCSHEEKNLTLETMAKFEVFADTNEFMTFKWEVIPNNFDVNQNYDFEFMKLVDGRRRLHFTQWRCLEFCMSEFEVLAYYEGSPLLQDFVVIHRHGKSGERYHRYEIMTRQKAKEQNLEFLRNEEDFLFWNKYHYYLTAIMNAHKDRENFTFKMDKKFLYQEQGLSDEEIEFLETTLDILLD